MSGSISGVSVQAAESPKSLITDVQFYEAYTSTALNRKFKNIIKQGIYSGFNVVPGEGLSVIVTSGEGIGAASVDIDNIQLSVQQLADIAIGITAGGTTIIALQAFYKFGVKTSQVTDESSINAAEIVTITDLKLQSGQIELCRVVVPDGATQITDGMIDTSHRLYQSLGLQLSSEIDSDAEGIAANLLAVKKAIAFLMGENVPKELSSLSKLADALGKKQPLSETLTELSEKSVEGILEYLGLGEGAKLTAATGSLADSGWITLPINGGLQLIVQWGRWDSGVTDITYNCDITFPVAFPTACFGIYSSAGVRTGYYDYAPSYRALRQAVSIGDPFKTGADAQFFIDDGLHFNARIFKWFAIGF